MVISFSIYNTHVHNKLVKIVGIDLGNLGETFGNNLNKGFQYNSIHDSD